MRLSVQAAIFLILMNAWVTAMGASGVTAVLGVEPEVGGDEAIESSEETANPDSVSGSGVVGAVDLAAFIVSGAFALFEAIKSLTVAAPLMFNKLMPGWLVTVIFSPFYLIIFKDLYGLVKSGD